MELRPHQIECVDKIKEHLKNENKALIKMFCGSGKSFVIYHCLLELGKNLSVVVVPSINLITQFNRDYLLDKKKQEYNEKKFNKKYKLITICFKNELTNDKSDFVFTTEDNDITKFLRRKEDKIVLITYQSLEKLVNIVKNNNITINLLCFDEAHHILGMKMKDLLFGKDEENQTNDDLSADSDESSNGESDVESNDLSLDNNTFIDDSVDKTLFFTATPQNRNGIMMYESYTNTSINDIEYEIIDDEDTTVAEEPHCGKMIYEYMHTNGVNDGILNDFKIRVDLYTENTDTSVFDAISRSILETGNNRVLTFHSRSETESDKGSNVKDFSNKKKEFIECFNRVQKKEFPKAKEKYKNIEFVGITAKTKNRSKILQEFDESSDNEIYVLASCKTIGEGVDTKRANMVCFVDPKQSYIEIVQNIGRICRKNDRLATVLIPAYVDVEKYKECKGDREKIDDIIRKEMGKTGNFNGILNVLSALRQEDPYTFELCLKYPETYTKKEIGDNLRRKRLILNDREYSKEEIFEKSDLKYKDKKTEIENFERLADALERNVQVINQKVLENDIVIDKGCDETFYLVKTEDGKFMKVKNEKKIKDKIDKVNRNIKPIVHTNDEIKVLWSLENNIDGKGVFGGFIKSTVIESGEDVWMKKLEEVKDYINKNKKRPTPHRTCGEIKKLGNWLDGQICSYNKNIKLMKNDKIKRLFAQFLKEYAQYFRSVEKIWEEKLVKIGTYMDKHKKLPSRTDKDNDVRILGRWVQHQLENYNKKMHLMKITEMRSKWEVFEKKYEKYFLSNEQIWYNTLNDVIKYISENEKKPSGTDKNKEIKQIGQWLNTQQSRYKTDDRIYKNKEIKKKYEEFLTKYEKYFLSNEEIWENTLGKIAKYIDENGKRPNTEDKENAENRSMARWLCVQKKNYKKNQYIMKQKNVRESWENFADTYKQYLTNNSITEEQKPTKKSTTIKAKEQTESLEQKRARIQSEYQELTKKMSTQKSSTTGEMFKNESLWHQYHDSRDFSFQGYDNQNEIPINKIIAYLETKRNHKLKILDLGCGRNLIRQHFKDNKKFNVVGYDHVAFNESKKADISDLPEEDESVKICVYSQSLMGSNWKEYLDESKRVLEYNGEIIVSESVERYDPVKKYLEEIGMKIIKEDYNEKNRWFFIHAIKQ